MYARAKLGIQTIPNSEAFQTFSAHWNPKGLLEKRLEEMKMRE
jgi:hypothetical protein